MRSLRRFALILLAIGLTAALVGWITRERIATIALSQVFADRGVRASFTVRDIGIRWQRIENVRLGDPANPDLTARWIEVQLATGWRGLHARRIRASGVRLNGRWNGRLSFGEVDKLLPAGGGAQPLALPQVEADLADVRLNLVTPLGAIDARIDGAGNLADGFDGRLLALASGFGSASCVAQGLSARLHISTRNGSPRWTGPVAASSLNCLGVTLTAPTTALDASLDRTLQSAQGRTEFRGTDIVFRKAQIGQMTGRMAFAGRLRNLAGTVTMAAPSARYGAHRASGVGLAGRFALADEPSAAMTLRVNRWRPDAAWAAQVNAVASRVRGLPISPLLIEVDRSFQSATRDGVALSAKATLSASSAQIVEARISGADGLLANLGGRRGIEFGRRGVFADTALSLSGPRLPPVQGDIRRSADGTTRGIFRMTPFASGGARLILEPVRFVAQPSGAMLLETDATIDGPVANGRVEGLNAPLTVFVDRAGALTVNPNCVALKITRLTLASMSVGVNTTRVCPIGGGLFRLREGVASGGARIAGFKIDGKLGRVPLAFTARGAVLDTARGAFVIDQAKTRIGNGNKVSALDIGRLTASFSSTIDGRFSDATGYLANVPLVLTDADGTWSLANGVFAMKARAVVADSAVARRFNPLVSNDVVLRLANGAVQVGGTLQHPATGATITRVAITHALSDGTGNALLTVDGIRFGEALQPEDITPLTIGTIANVVGPVSGQGRIAWSARGVTSTGRFTTDGLNLAAAFGPVTGLSGTIMFDDLLAMSTPPGQQAMIASINPGTPITQGRVQYQLRAGQRMAVEGGAWPFAGGQLLLDPTVLDFGRPARRLLTFRVVALDAAKFIERFEFDNLAATGLFDGTIPMIFDASGGRIENGRIVARQGGGTLAYVGEVSNAEMNVFAKLAFDALKSIRYDNLAIDLDGPLDGEMISRVDFTGVNEASSAEKRSFLARRFSNLPFKFNIVIRAPFRGLLSTAKTFQDPSGLFRRLEPLPPPVQPGESVIRP